MNVKVKKARDIGAAAPCFASWTWSLDMGADDSDAPVAWTKYGFPHRRAAPFDLTGNSWERNPARTMPDQLGKTTSTRENDLGRIIWAG